MMLLWGTVPDLLGEPLLLVVASPKSRFGPFRPENGGAGKFLGLGRPDGRRLGCVAEIMMWSTYHQRGTEAPELVVAAKSVVGGEKWPHLELVHRCTGGCIGHHIPRFCSRCPRLAWWVDMHPIWVLTTSAGLALDRVAIVWPFAAGSGSAAPSHAPSSGS